MKLAGSVLPRVAAALDWRQDLPAIEQALAACMGAGRTHIEVAARRALLRGGKRVRPLLTCALMRALERNPQERLACVVAVEMAHAGSLLHDDIIDETRLRRGGLAGHVAFDVPIAVLAGDRLVMLAVEQLARHGSKALLVAFCAAVEQLCLGESLERERRHDATVSLDHVREINLLKTASLFAYAAEAGAILAGASRRIRRAARTYGLALGQAFQATDDCLDLFGDSETLGKPVGQDLAAGLVTLPVAVALEREPQLQQELVELWSTRQPDASASQVAALRDHLLRLDAYAASLRLAAQDAARAAEAIQVLPPSPWRDQLRDFAKSIVTRLS